MDNKMMEEHVQKLRKAKIGVKLAIIEEKNAVRESQEGKITAECRECCYNTDNVEEIDKHEVTDGGDHICPDCGNLLIVTEH